MTNLMLSLSAGGRATPLASLARGALRRLALWAERRRQRRDLAALDAHVLRDIGLNAELARREAEKWFWMS